MLYCFIPCCKRQEDCGLTINPPQAITQNDLTPPAWIRLTACRQLTKALIDTRSRPTAAIRLYRGLFYMPIQAHLNNLIAVLQRRECRLFIISGCYGVIDAMQTVQKYDRQVGGLTGNLRGATARIWTQNNALPSIIADLIATGKPDQVLGFVGGDSTLQGHRAIFRYCFEEGVRLARQQGFAGQAESFFPVGAGGFQNLFTLGHAFITGFLVNCNPLLVRGFHSGRITISNLVL